MKVFYEPALKDFNAWSGAIATQTKILEADKDEEFCQLIEDMYPDGLNETELNDILWFEDEMLFQELGMSTEDEESEEE